MCDQHEAAQRCAAEFIAAIIRGSKHWPFDMVNDLWSFLGPLLRLAFNNVNVESIGDWGTAIATASENRDPNRNHWLMELILEDPIRVEQVMNARINHSQSLFQQHFQNLEHFQLIKKVKHRLITKFN